MYPTVQNFSTSSLAGFVEPIVSDLIIDRSLAFQVIADHLFDLALVNKWFSNDPYISNGVAIRVGKGQYVISPRNDSRLDEFRDAIIQLNQEVIITFSARVVQAVTNSLRGDFAPTLALTASENIQIFDDMEELGTARNAQGACFIRNEGILVLWCSDISELETHVRNFQQLLVNFVWRCASESATDLSIRTHPSTMSLVSKSITDSPKSFTSNFTSLWSRTKPPSTPHHLESELEKEKGYGEGATLPIRPSHRYKDIYTGIAIALDIAICTLSLNTFLRECLIDGEWIRLSVCAGYPFIFGVAFFFCENVVAFFALILGPIGQLSKNSFYFSAVPPARLTRYFPHLTIMIPVYKESLVGVLAPTIESVQHAIRTYELQGGTANILMCEDGLQLVDEDELSRRMDYYERNNCAYVARHPSNRAGRFKKSSNMNTALDLSLRVEVLLSQQRTAHANYSQYDEDILYEKVLQQALLELEGRVWSQGDIRIGDYILLLDSDTRIPVDCFLDSISELEQCPDVAILQHCSGTFLAGAGYFENYMAFFTQMINYSISLVVSNGIIAPFVGHNAFLRWSAMQEQAYISGDPLKRIWSEEHVSEDFVMSLNLASAGYLIRWVTYSNSGFLEGVSLSCDDELNRWQKYAFGCSEVIFNPLRYWFTKSPFSSLYIKFLRNKGTTLASKFTTTSYILSYWAIAAGAPVTIVIYWLTIFFREGLDLGYSTPLSTFATIILVFLVGSNVSFVLSRYRSKDSTFFAAAWSQILVLPLTLVFFGGLSWHVLIALAAHMFSYDMTWSATIKDVTDTSFFEELPRALKKYWHTLLVMTPTLVAAIIFSTGLVGLHLQQTNVDHVFPFSLDVLRTHFISNTIKSYSHAI